MEFNNEFRVPVSIEQAWEVLTDVERVVPCIPGTQLLSVDGDEFTGVVKVKVGPITASYQGKACFQEKDVCARRAVIKADGKETRGQGNASAVMTAQLKDEGGATSCVLTTDLMISGKAAQFGRGVLADVATNLIGQFANNLEADLLGGSAASVGGGAVQTATPTTTQADGVPSGAVDSVNLLKVVALPMAKRFAPVIAGVGVGVAVGFLLARRTRKSPTTAVVEDLQATLRRLLS